MRRPYRIEDAGLVNTAEEIHEVSEGPVVLSDGSAATIRRLTQADLPAVRRLHECLPVQDIYLRFFGVSLRGASEAARLVVGEDSVAVGLFRDGLLEGVANYRGANPPDMAFAVAHSAQRRGIGTLLLEALIALARDRGIRVLEADVLATNSSMFDVLADSGLSISRQYDGPVTHLRVAVPEQIEGAYAAALSRRHPPGGADPYLDTPSSKPPGAAHPVCIGENERAGQPKDQWRRSRRSGTSDAGVGGLA